MICCLDFYRFILYTFYMIKKPLYFRFRRGRCLGNASDEDMEWAKPVSLINEEATNRVGVLLLHGFKQNPFSMHLIRREIENDVYRLIVPVLPGHDTDYHDIEAGGADDWLQRVYADYQTLHSTCDHVIILGLSMGAVLAALIEAEFDSTIDQLVLLAPAFYPPYLLNLAPLINKVSPFFGKRYIKNRTGFIRCKNSYDLCFSHAPIDSYFQLHNLCVKGRQILPFLTCPIDFFSAKYDCVLRRGGVKKAFKQCGSPKKQWFTLNDSDHVISLDNDLPEVLERLRFHIQRLS